MASSRCALRFHRIDGGLGLDHFLAHDRGGASERDHFAHQVSEGAAFLLDSAVRLALLGSLRGTALGSFIDRFFTVSNPDDDEALIAKCISQNIARWRPNGRHEM